MKVLVAGGAGYIGSVTSRILHEASHEVIIFDNLSTGHKKALGSLNLIEGDDTSLADVEALFAQNKFDIVMNFAAKIQVEESMKEPGLYLHNNFLGALNLIDQAAQHGVRGFVFSSTAAVYGAAKKVPITEDSPTEPINPYGLSKLFVEQALGSYQATKNLNWVAFRYFNAAGAYGGLGEEHPVETHLIPLAISAMSNGEDLQVNGTDYETKDGSCVRDYVHVEDIARAHILAAEAMMHGTILSAPLNLGSGGGASVLEVIKTIGKVSGQKVPYATGPRRAGDPPALVASNARAHELLGWAPQHDLRRIVQDALDFNRSRQ